MFIHAYYELIWGTQKLGSHWRIQVNFKKAKNEESSSSKVKALITHNSRTLLDGILSYGILPNSQSYLMGIYILYWL